MPIAQFDILETFGVMEGMFPEAAEDAADFKEKLLQPTFLGYETYNFFSNLGVFSIVILMYFFLLILYFTMIYPRRMQSRFYRKWYRKLRFQVMYGLAINISLGGFFEIIVSVYMSLTSPDMSSEHILLYLVLSYLFGWVLIVFLPVVFTYLMMLPVSVLAQPRTREKWGMYFLNVDFRSPMKLMYQNIFVIRRLAFVSIAFLLLPFGGV